MKQEPRHRVFLYQIRTEKCIASVRLQGSESCTVLLSKRYLINEDGVIVRAFGGVKAKDNPQQMLGEL